jgi:AcrR family transcriptional regulator
MSAARDRWLDEGLRVLAEDGEVGVRIDRIAARLSLSKGSFHHHFRGADDYKRQLLEHFERGRLDTLRDAISGMVDVADARTVLASLTALVGNGDALYDPSLDLAVRAWSTWDEEAREVQSRVDAEVVAALQGVWRGAVATDEEARTAAMLPYLLAVGATMVVPAVGAEELRRMYELLLPLVPGAESSAPDIHL